MFAVARSSSPFQNSQESIINALEASCIGISRVRSPQPVKVPSFPRNNNFYRQKENEIAATEELQNIVSFTPSETLSVSSFLVPGRLEVPVLALSPSLQERNSKSPNLPQMEDENIPSRSYNPLVLNTPFIEQNSANSRGAELGLLSPSPPPRAVVAHPVVNIEKFESAEARKQKRLRSVSCPEAKHLLLK
mmetsp:Transcript_114454/g.171149  ORF Transcript_114454/g.171149 Transcript_114454/m.171149 type:complete len:191 (-) Transcript_114454:81-653(-)